MAFWSRLFKRKKQKDKREDSWEDIVYDSQSVNFEDEEQRSRYITNCLEQIADASREVNLLTGEYKLVTSCLTDLEEIEALPAKERDEVNDIARRLLTLEQESERYRSKKIKMSDSEYHHMRNQEEEVQEGISKLKECQAYGNLVRQDLKRLDRERHAYEYRRSELEIMMNNYRGMTLIFMAAFVVCILFLLILYFWQEMNIKAGCLIAVGLAAVAVTVTMVKYTDRERELKKVRIASNKLIQLQNKVKIRYVNNNRLQEYLCIKYQTKNAEELEKRWELYRQEKEERREYAETEAKTEYYKKQLVHKMAQYHVSDPDRWMNHPGALLDKREMVEIRHDLIVRRQALRKQMDYNHKVAETARWEIMNVVNKYPKYASEILTMVDRYET